MENPTQIHMGQELKPRETILDMCSIAHQILQLPYEFSYTQIIYKQSIDHLSSIKLGQSILIINHS